MLTYEILCVGGKNFRCVSLAGHCKHRFYVNAFCYIMREDVCVFVADHGGRGISVLFQILRHEKVRVLFHGELFRHEGVLFSA